MKKITILGSTGSIGRQTLNVISANSNKMRVHGLVAFSNGRLLDQQAQQFGAHFVALISQEGEQCLIDAVKGCDIAVIATRGIIALDAVLYCINNNIDIALANKETLVTAGEIIMPMLKTSKSRLLPIDSEHSAIWQCLYNNDNAIDRLYLTASGGALYDYDNDSLVLANAKQALQHPNWSMGDKITIDSASMMNKALEVVEAHWLFGVDKDSIDIVVHRQSIVHSMVRFEDNSILAQLSKPNMALAIQYALLYPQRGNAVVDPLDIMRLQSLTFEEVDLKRFPCAGLGKLMIELGGLIPTVINACNDICVQCFLEGKLFFGDIYDTIVYILDCFQPHVQNIDISINNIKQIDSKVRQFSIKYIMEKYDK